MQENSNEKLDDISRFHYKELFENSMSAIFFTKPDGSILDANPAACKMFDYTVEEFRKLGRDKVIDTSTPALQEFVLQRKEHGSAKAELIGIRKNGERFTMEVSSSVFYDAQKTAFTCIIANDISERKKVEQETALMINNTAESFILLDRDLRIVSFNAQCQKFYQQHFKQDLVKGVCLLDYIVPERREISAKIYERVLAGASEELEYSVNLPDQTTGYFIVRYHPAKNNFGEIIGVFITSVDKTAQKQSEIEQQRLSAQLKARNKFIELILEYLPIGIAVNNIEDGGVTLINKQFTAIYGWSEEELRDVDTFFTKVYPDENYRNQMKQRIFSDIQSGIRERMQWNNVFITTSSGEERIVNARNIPIYEENLMISTVLDVTHESRQAAAIRLAKFNQEALINGTTDLIWSVDKAFRLITANKSFHQLTEQVTGYPIQEGDSIFKEAYGSAKNSEWKAHYQRAFSGEAFSIRESIFNPFKNCEQHNLISFNGMYNGEGELYGVVCNAKDITEEILNIEALKVAKYKLGRVLDSSLDMICAISADGIFSLVSRASEQILGYTPDEMIGKKFSDFIYPEDLSVTQYQIEHIMEGNLVPFIRNRYIHKSGRIVQMEWSARWDAESKLRYAVGRDVTEKMKMENALLSSEQKYRNLFDENPFPMIIWDFETKKILDCNATTLEKYGYTREEFLALTIWDLRPEEDIPLLNEYVRDESSYGPVHRRIWRHKKKNGELMMIDLKGQLIDYNGRRASLVISNDVTERILAEEKLRETEAYLAEARRLAKMGNWNYDLHSDKVTWSDELYDVFGIDKHSFGESFDSFISLVHPEDKELVISNNRQTRILGDPFTIEYRITTPSGEQKIIEEFGYGQKDTEGTVVRIFGTAQDITERKKAEQNIRDANQRYEYVTKATFDSVWDWDIPTHKVIWGENYYRIFGFKEDPALSDIENILARIHHDEKEYLLNSINAALHSDAAYWEDEHRFLRSDGSYAFVSNNALIIRDKQGEAVRVIGAMQDITKQKEEEQHLRLLESVITNTQDAVLITEAEPLDAPGPRIVYVNEAFTKMSGYSAEEVIGRSPRILQGPKSDRNELARLSNALRKWEACEITTINYKKSGEEFWINFSVSPVADKNGWYTHWIAIERDVTIRKLEELQHALFSKISSAFAEPLELKQILEKVTDEICRFADLDVAETWLISTDQCRINLITKSERNSDIGWIAHTREYWSLSMNEGLVGKVWDSKTIQYWNNISDLDNFIRKEDALQAGLQHIWGIPLLYGQEIIGVLMFLSRHESAESHKKNELLFSTLGSHLSTEIKRKQLEQELSRIFSIAPDIISIVGTDGYFKKINPALTDMLGYSEQELLSVPYIDFVHPDDRAETIREQENFLKGDLSFLFENRWMTRSGKYIWISWTATPLLEESLFFAVGKDVTDGKELQQLLDSATTMAQIGGWESDLIQDTYFWSDITRDIHEVDESYVPDFESSKQFIKEMHRPLFIKSFSDAMIHGTAYDIEVQLITAKGNEKWVRFIGQAEFINNKCIRVFGSCQDINTQKLNALAVTQTLREKDTILESIGDAFFAVDQDLRITYWNRMAESVLGKSRAEVMDRHLYEVYQDDFTDNYHYYLNAAFSEQKNQRFEMHLASLDLWHEVSVYPSPQGLSVYVKDITYRKHAEKEIRESNERYHLAAKATNDIIWDWDLANNLLIRNADNIERMLGYPPEVSQSPDFDWLSLIHPDDADRIKQHLFGTVQSGEKSYLDDEYRVKKADGTYTYVYERAYILRDDKGKALRVIGSTEDISKMKENELQLKKRAEELAVSNMELEQFAFVASHDLQEPLRMITSFLTQLDKKYEAVLDEKAKQYIYFAVDGAKRMRQIILDLLEYSRVGRVESVQENINMQDLLNEVTLLLQKKIKEKQAIIRIDPLPVIFSYTSPVRQVFQNLISNALKYSKKDIPPQIHIGVKEYPDHWQFFVADNGIGIHSDYFEKVFILFQRLHPNSEYSGTGMGLTISKKIAESLGGKIWLESEEGVGTTFYVQIPK
jgi:PAS domain S-box-containing protein